MTDSRAGSAIDALMERASEALVSADYFRASALCDRALHAARHALDYERMARICMPRQEARRQVRQIAESTGVVRVLTSADELSMPPAPGCVLIRPPLIGMDARMVRDAAERAHVPVFVLAAEPLTTKGMWPIVGVVPLREAPTRSIRAYVEPPRDPGAISVEWFVSAGEALGDAAIARIPATAPSAHRVDDLLESLDAVPEHEKLHQALERACRDAAAAPSPLAERRRPIVDDPRSF